MKYNHVYALFLVLVFHSSCNSQTKTDLSKDNIKPGSKELIASRGPQIITRNIIQDKKGNIWIAAFDGIFKYDGKSFTNITGKVSSSHFFSVLEDSKGNMWFGSIGSGVFLYDGRSFRNFTTREGLAGNGVTCIYEDKKGKIWFGTGEGVSCYDGKAFKNFTTKERMPVNGVNAIIEDKTGKFWFATSSNTFVYDGKTLTVFAHQGKPFTNVRSIAEDKKGNIWLGGSDGLWRYDGSTFTNFTPKFVGHIIEDKKGNIWTSSESANSQARAISMYDRKTIPNNSWALSRYDGQSLSDKKPIVTEIMYKGMFFGILEANDGSIWFGSFDGVYRYDGKTVTDFKSKEKSYCKKNQEIRIKN
jgi:ligand-binding sensor domain-containing protein